MALSETLPLAATILTAPIAFRALPHSLRFPCLFFHSISSQHLILFLSVGYPQSRSPSSLHHPRPFLTPFLTPSKYTLPLLASSHPSYLEFSVGTTDARMHHIYVVDFILVFHGTVTTFLSRIVSETLPWGKS